LSMVDDLMSVSLSNSCEQICASGLSRSIPRVRETNGSHPGRAMIREVSFRPIEVHDLATQI
jgi:hypothetical protein